MIICGKCDRPQNEHIAAPLMTEVRYYCPNSPYMERAKIYDGHPGDKNAPQPEQAQETQREAEFRARHRLDRLEGKVDSMSFHDRRITELEKKVEKLSVEVAALNDFTMQTFELNKRKFDTLGKRTSRRK